MSQKTESYYMLPSCAFGIIRCTLKTVSPNNFQRKCYLSQTYSKRHNNTSATTLQYFNDHTVKILHKLTVGIQWLDVYFRISDTW